MTAFSITIFGIMTLSITVKCDTQQNILMKVVMKFTLLSVIMLNVLRLNVVMLNI